MTALPEEHVPSPADTPEYTAEELLAYIEERGGRIFRQVQNGVFVLTQDPDLARWLLSNGGRGFLPPNLAPEHLGPKRAYRRTREGPWEWDIYVHMIPVTGEETIWEAARAFRHGRRIEE